MDLIVIAWIIFFVILMYLGVQLQKLFARADTANTVGNSQRNNINIFSVEHTSRSLSSSASDQTKEKDGLPSYEDIFPDCEPPNNTTITTQGSSSNPTASNSRGPAIIAVEDNGANK